MGYTGEKARIYSRNWAKNNREKKREYARKWRNKNRKHVKEYNHQWWIKNQKSYLGYAYVLRNKIFDHYGYKCSCCEENRYEFLSIDHINGGGAKFREKIRGIMYYKWIIDNNYPDNLRILCHNCNMAIGMYGYCPHNNLKRGD